MSLLQYFKKNEHEKNLEAARKIRDAARGHKVLICPNCGASVKYDRATYPTYVICECGHCINGRQSEVRNGDI